MSAQSLLSSVFSCSSPAAPAARSLSKRRLRQTRSLDPAIIGGGRDEGEGRGRATGSPPGERRGARGAPPPPRGFSASTPSTPLERSPPGSGLFEPDSPRGKRSPGRELPFLARTPSANSIFSSPRRWLQQRKGQPSPPGPRPAAYVVWRSEVGSPASATTPPSGPRTGGRLRARPPAAVTPRNLPFPPRNLPAFTPRRRPAFTPRPPALGEAPRKPGEVFLRDVARN